MRPLSTEATRGLAVIHVVELGAMDNQCWNAISMLTLFWEIGLLNSGQPVLQYE